MAGIKIADLPGVTSSLAADDRIPISRGGVTYQMVGELFIPTGTIIAFASDSVTPPGGWLYCDGAPYSTTAFSRLNGVIGTKFNVTNPGTGLFRVPDLRGRFIRGYATVAAGGIATAAFGAQQDDAFQGHYHSASTTGYTANGEGGTGTGSANSRLSGGLAPNTTVTSPTTDGTNGTPRTASETRPRNIAVYYYIKY